jgi:two-component system chemotaxis response regulator CheB
MTQDVVAQKHSDVRRDVILIGASVGGIDAIGNVLRRLPKELGAAVAITLHRSPKHVSTLAEIFARSSPLPVVEPTSAELFRPGHVYLAPRDRHLVFGGGLVLPDHGPRENYARPSIDVMFRSGAEHFGGRVIGVVLTGNLSDGVQGLKAIKRHGGLSLAQEPAEAPAPSMPLNAVAYDDVDIVFRIAAGGEVLSKLVARSGVSAALRTIGARPPGGQASTHDE